ncbi:hypothetical protein ACFL7D_05110 [candidate division KSB1 bacterium]
MKILNMSFLKRSKYLLSIIVSIILLPVPECSLYAQGILINKDIAHTLRDSSFLSSNVEELIDIFRQKAGFSILDQEALGQFSTITFKGSNKNNTVPVINGIPLESESFGSWNWLDIPYSILKEVSFNEINNENIGYLSPIDLKSIDRMDEVPYTKINYKVGDYDWSHTDISFRRRVGSKMSFFVSGNTEHFSDIYADNKYRGSGFWFDLRYNFKDYVIKWQTMLSDKNNMELTWDVDFQINEFKNMRHSHNVKMTSLSIFDRNQSENDYISLYQWEIKDNGQGSLIFDEDFYNNDRKTGLKLARSIYNSEMSDIGIYSDINTTKINSSFFEDQRINNGRMSVRMSFQKNENFKFTIFPELKYRTGYDKPLLLFVTNILYDGLEKTDINLGFSRTYRNFSKSELYLKNSFGFDNGINREVINMLFGNIEYHSDKYSICVNPFIIKNDKVFIPFMRKFDLSNVENVFNDDNIFGINFIYKRSINSIYGIEFSQSFLDVKDKNIFGNNYSAGFKINARNIEDKFLKLDIDTDINISAEYLSGGNKVVYLPLLQQFISLDENFSSLLKLKINASAQVSNLRFFYELDLSTNGGYQNILGYPVREKMLRVGLIWDFYN